MPSRLICAAGGGRRGVRSLAQPTTPDTRSGTTIDGHTIGFAKRCFQTISWGSARCSGEVGGPVGLPGRALVGREGLLPAGAGGRSVRPAVADKDWRALMGVWAEEVADSVGEPA